MNDTDLKDVVGIFPDRWRAKRLLMELGPKYRIRKSDEGWRIVLVRPPDDEINPEGYQ